MGRYDLFRIFELSSGQQVELFVLIKKFHLKVSWLLGWLPSNFPLDPAFVSLFRHGISPVKNEGI